MERYISMDGEVYSQGERNISKSTPIIWRHPEVYEPGSRYISKDGEAAGF